MSTHLNARRRHAGAGFTLIELMIVVAVVAILAAVAYPTYLDSVRKSKRNDVMATLAELAQRAERFHTVNNTYEGFFAQLQSKNDPLLTQARDYGVTAADDAQTFTLTATPQAGSPQAKDMCGTLTLDQAGRRSAKNGSSTVTGCW